MEREFVAVLFCVFVLSLGFYFAKRRYSRQDILDISFRHKVTVRDVFHHIHCQCYFLIRMVLPGVSDSIKLVYLIFI